MIPRIAEAKYVAGYKVALKFEDGAQGVIDLEAELWGEVFEPLIDPELFKQVRLDRDLNTICWENGADFAPEFLYEAITSNPVAGTGSLST
jgi:hypothetical protein